MEQIKAKKAVKKARNQYSPEFKKQVLDRAEKEGIATVARDFGLKEEQQNSCRGQCLLKVWRDITRLGMAWWTPEARYIQPYRKASILAVAARDYNETTRATMAARRLMNIGLVLEIKQGYSHNVQIYPGLLSIHQQWGDSIRRWHIAINRQAL